MSSPIGHSLLGGTAGYLFLPSRQMDGWRMLLFILLLANLPDIDYLLGYLTGNPNQWHQHWTHSIFFAVTVSAAVAVWAGIRHSGQAIRLGLTALAILMSHLLLDTMGRDTRYPFGIQLLWPLDTGFYQAPVTLFPGISKSSSSSTFLSSLFCLHNLRVVLIELGIFGPMFLGAVLLRRKRQK